MDATAYSGTGVFVDFDAQRNKIVRNKIYCNSDLGIRLVPGGNQNVAAPAITGATANTVSGSGLTDGDSIHVYYNRPPSGVCDCEGETFIGATIVSGGSWTITHNLNYSIPNAYNVTATVTNATNST